MSETRHVAVLGGGSFGTAIARIVGENGHPVRLWMRDTGQAEEIRTTRINSRYLPDVILPEQVSPTTDIHAALKGADAVFLSIPSKAFRQVVGGAKDSFHDGQIVVSTTKGIERDGFRLMSEILQQEIPRTRIGVLSGPNLAGEIVRKNLTAT
ncbi:MAG: NAD(P)-binding domain-containing protein, partial [Gammaproteobacteria bacterium]|nr:NAD(P)-binding domain-containing protein [Gammaproteobacteria bacterium]